MSDHHKTPEPAPSPLPAGYPHPAQSRKAHYFASSSTKCLCGKYGFYIGQRDDDNHGSPDNCAACKKRRPEP